jgi:hypothetical protein
MHGMRMAHCSGHACNGAHACRHRNYAQQPTESAWRVRANFVAVRTAHSNICRNSLLRSPGAAP